MFWIYIIQNPAGQFYIGHVDDFTVRLKIIIESKNLGALHSQERAMDAGVVARTSRSLERNAARAGDQILEIRAFLLRLAFRK